MGAVQDHFSADGFKGYYDGQKMMDRITALPSAKAKDIIAPKIKAECRIDEHGVLWVETKQWEKVNRVCFEYNFCPNCGAKMYKE